MSTRDRFVWSPETGMPRIGLFSRISDLPESVRQRLTEVQQRRWMEVVNSTFAQISEDGEGDLEEWRAAAFRAADKSVG